MSANRAPAGNEAPRNVPPRTTSELAIDLARDASLLARQEAKLVRAEAEQKLDDISAGLIYVVIGAALLSGALLALLASAVAALSTLYVVPVWLAALVVGLSSLILALIFLAIARWRVTRKPS